MTLIVGYAPDEHGKAALPLAVMLARSSGEDLVVCSVVRRVWPASLAGTEVDDLEEGATAALDRARRLVPEDVSAEYAVVRARSVPSGLLKLARERDTSALVLGSSADGVYGHIALGSTSDRLLHSSPVSVAVAPRGFRCAKGATVQRLTLAYGGSEQADTLAVAAAGKAAQFGASLRLASFMVRVRPDYTMTLGVEGETGILDTWAMEMQGALKEAVEEVSELPAPPETVETAIGKGATWDEALEDLEWLPSELLVVGSSAVAAVARVFMGSRATKIMRHSPVPVVLMPRERAEQLAEEAEDRA